MEPTHLSTRDRIVQSAIRLFAEKGYGGTSVRDIVQNAGVTKPALYYYFKGKAQLFEYILDWAAQEQTAMLAEIRAATGTAEERIVVFCRTVRRRIMENVFLFKMIHNLLFGPQQTAPAYDVEAFHRRMAEAIETIYSDGVAARELRAAAPGDVASLVLGLLDFSNHLEQLHPDEMDPERSERLIRLAFQGLSHRTGGRDETR